MAVGILVAIIAFMSIIVIHEFGHFIAARRNGVFVEEFAVGMGPKIIGRTSQKGTLWAWRLIPIGGFCAMRGESEEVDEEGSFSKASLGQKARIIAAGPVMNFVLAFVLSFMMIMADGYVTQTIVDVDTNSHAYAAGIREGDVVEKVWDTKIHLYHELNYQMSVRNPDEPLVLTVRHRDGTREEISYMPERGEEEGTYYFGYSFAKSGDLLYNWNRYTVSGVLLFIWRAIKQSFWSMLFYMRQIFRTIAMLVTGRTGLKAISGPIGIVSNVSHSYMTAAKTGVMNGIKTVINFFTMISVNIGVVNLMPIPSLDGSRLIQLGIEKITGKKLSEEAESRIFTIGFFVIIAIMVLVALHDIYALL